MTDGRSDGRTDGRIEGATEVRGGTEARTDGGAMDPDGGGIEADGNSEGSFGGRGIANEAESSGGFLTR
jgi:hypothetical protein